jgi:hypothetical protein
VPTNVLVVQDDQHLSSLLERLLASDPRLLVAARARTEIAAAALCWEVVPEAIVVEQHGGGVQWWDLLPELRRYCPDTCLVLLTDVCGDDLPTTAKVADHVLPRHSPWDALLQLLAPPVCEDEAYDPLPLAQ